MAARGSSSIALAWLAHPVTVVAAVVLLVNDQVLKAAHPGLITGKLSDAAGLVVAPALLATCCAVAVPRLPARPVAIGAILATGAGFTSVKATVAGAHAASAVWSLVHPSQVLADPTDLAALPALALAWWSWRRAATVRVPQRALAVRRTAVALPLAGLAVAATTAPYEVADSRVIVWHRQVVVVGVRDYPIDYASTHAYSAVATADGIAWHDVDLPELAKLDQLTRRAPVTRACVPTDPAHCFRVVPGKLAVDESTDAGGAWHRAWEVSDGRRGYLVRQHGAPDPVDEDLRSAEVAVLPQPGGGFLVLVANRVDGVAVRLPDGTWRRGLPSAERGLVATPLTSPGDDVLREVVLAVLLGAALLFFALQPKLRRYPRMAAWTGGSALLGIALIDLAALIPWLLNLVAAGVGVLAVLAGAPTWLAMVVRDQGLRAWYVLSALAISLATGFGVALPFLGWSAGTPDRYATAVGLAAVAITAGAAGTVLLAVLARRHLPGLPAVLCPAAGVDEAGAAT
jgi:hypothetical protein